MSDRTRRNFGRVMKRDGGRCRYCGELADSVDRVMPWAYQPNNSPSKPGCGLHAVQPDRIRSRVRIF